MANDITGFPTWNTWAYDMSEEQRQYEQHRLLYTLSERLAKQDECIVDLQSRVQHLETDSTLQSRVQRLENDPERKKRKGDRLSNIIREYGLQALIGLFVAAYFIARYWGS